MPIGMVVLEMLRWRCPPLLVLMVLLISWIPALYNRFDLDYVEYMAGAAVVHEKCKQETRCVTLNYSLKDWAWRFRGCIAIMQNCTYCRAWCLIALGQQRLVGNVYDCLVVCSRMPPGMSARQI